MILRLLYFFKVGYSNAAHTFDSTFEFNSYKYIKYVQLKVLEMVYLLLVKEIVSHDVFLRFLIHFFFYSMLQNMPSTFILMDNHAACD